MRAALAGWVIGEKMTAAAAESPRCGRSSIAPGRARLKDGAVCYRRQFMRAVVAEFGQLGDALHDEVV